MNKRTLRYWVAFNRVNGIGAARINLLLAYYKGDLETAWHAPESTLQQAINNKPAFDNLIKARQTADLDSDVAAIAKIGARAVTLMDDDYPRLLRQIPNPPPILYVRGTLLASDERAIGIVGTRDASDYGLQAARYFAVNLIKAGVTIVSGLARGIDSAAHKATVTMGGRTFALLGHGLDTIYPKENAQLADSIAQQGALISEFPIGMRPDAGNFPMRNRLISGLSLGVIVVEAGIGSGALGTARHALEQNRDVFAVPGGIFKDENRGTNLLIQAGEAKLVMTVSDVLDEYLLNAPLFAAPVPDSEVVADAPPAAPKADRKAKAAAPKPAVRDLSEDEAVIVGALSGDAHYIDELCQTTGFSAPRVMSLLTVLELDGIVREATPRCYTLGS